MRNTEGAAGIVVYAGGHCGHCGLCRWVVWASLSVLVGTVSIVVYTVEHSRHCALHRWGHQGISYAGGHCGPTSAWSTQVGSSGPGANRQIQWGMVYL